MVSKFPFSMKFVKFCTNLIHEINKKSLASVDYEN